MRPERSMTIEFLAWHTESPVQSAAQNCCTNPPPERPKTTRNTPEPPIFCNNIHEAGSIRNRQVIGSSPIVGSRFPIVYRQSIHLLLAQLLHSCPSAALSEMGKAARCESPKAQHPLLLHYLRLHSRKESYGYSKHIVGA